MWRGRDWRSYSRVGRAQDEWNVLREWDVIHCGLKQNFSLLYGVLRMTTVSEHYYTSAISRVTLRDIRRRWATKKWCGRRPSNDKDSKRKEWDTDTISREHQGWNGVPKEWFGSCTDGALAGLHELSGWHLCNIKRHDMTAVQCSPAAVHRVVAMKRSTSCRNNFTLFQLKGEFVLQQTDEKYLLKI